MAGFAEYIRSSSTQLSLVELLQQPVTELLGVGADAQAALAGIGVETIFDLGSSSVFASASAVLAAASSSLRVLGTDVLDATAPVVPVEEAGALPLEHLRGISPDQAAALSTALDVDTIREFALWPPRQLAHRLVGKAAGASDEDDGTAEELRPRLGEYPTERVYYDTLVMLGTRQEGELTEFTQPLSLGRLTDPAIGFGTPAVGAVATYAQSWFAQGITLGHMVHSLALAPGEATRIAVVDWSRRTRASTSESIAESEQLDNSTLHARAVSEVQNAVADEMQSGGSIATGWSKSSSKVSGFAGSIGGGIAGSIGSAAGALGFGFGGSSSSQRSETESRATSASWSVGSRSVMAEMSQRVNDRTEQHSTSVRNRRASAVREVSQSEHEQVSTRIVANYNHMHALTIQYYEVVQIYRVSVRLHQFVRALFVPFEMLDFSGADAMERVTRFRNQLLGAALTPRAAELLLDDRGRVEVRSAVRVPFAINVATLAEVAPAMMLARRATEPGGGAGTGGTTGGGSAGTGGGTSTPEPGTSAPTRITRLSSVRAGPIEEVLPGDAKLVSIAFEDVGVARVRIDQAGETAEAGTFPVPPDTDKVDFANGIVLRTVQGIQVARDAEGAGTGSMVLRYESEGHPGIAVVPLSLIEGDRMQKVAFFNADTADRRAELLSHLQSNRGHYTRAVLGSLDSASLVQLLAGLSWQGRPLADQVEPRPVAVTGNYFVLRAPVEADEPGGLADDQTWGELMEERGIDFADENTRLVPIPTGGVFAEAVLGRSNSAEKLDITRFWNWQDSPIPLQPPEIAPVATGSRATAEDLRPGALGAPVLNVMAPTALPEAAGLGAVLGAVANGSMFRDMSGLAGTQATAQAASAGTLTAATEAGRIASENFKAATTQATEMGKAAADMWKVKNTPKGDGSGNAGSARPGGISGEGARINHGKDMDRRSIPGTTTAAASKPDAVSASQPVFASSSETIPPVGFSRELAYSDESAAVSPQLVGATTAALGSSALAGQGLAGFLNPVDVVADVARGIGETLILAIIRADAQRAGVVQGATLLPMRRHDNHADFEAVGYAAWTNSAQHVYVNIPFFIDTLNQAVAGGTTLDDALGQVRALAVTMVRHEEEHVQQFAGPGGGPPASFADMVVLEEQAYGNDATWLQSAPVKTFMLNDLGVDQAFINMLGSNANGSKTLMTSLRTNPPANLKKKMIDEKMLPRQIQGNANYVIADMYKTAPP